MKPSSSSSIIAESQKLMFKLCEIAGRFRHGVSISTAAVRRHDLHRMIGDPSEDVG